MDQPSIFLQFLPLILIFVVFYFLLIRPQQKRMKQHREMLESLRRGDRVVTGGGIIGQIVKVGQDDELTVEIGDGMRVKVLRSTITALLAKSEPVKNRGKAADDKAEDDAEDERDEAASAEDTQTQKPAAAAGEGAGRKGLSRFLKR